MHPPRPRKPGKVAGFMRWLTPYLIVIVAVVILGLITGAIERI